MRPLLYFSAGERLWKTAFLVVLVSGLLATFLIPFHLPVPPAWSDSYMFGYNNRVGESLFLGLVVCVGLIAKVGGLVLPVGTRTGAAPASLSRSVLWICLGTSTVLAGCLFWLAHPGAMADGAYFLDRIRLIEQGEVPYRDFEFVYGSLSLYASVYLGRFLHIGSVNGYYLLWLAETLSGVWLLWLFVRWLDLPEAGKRRVFLLFYGLSLTYLLSTALNYCPLRYALPLFGLLALCRIDQGTSVARRVGTVGFAVLMVAALLGLSPEEGIAFACATVIYLPLRRHFAGRPYGLDLVVLIAALVGAYRLAARVGAFGTMKGFAAGAFNLPVYPAPHILFWMAAVLTMVCVVASGRLAERVPSNVCFVLIYELGMVPGALGRCDTTHIGGYEMGILICFLLYVSRWPRVWQGCTWGCAAVFLICPMSISLLLAPPTYSKLLLAQVYHDGGPHGAFDQAIDRMATKLATRTMGVERGREKLEALRASVGNSLDPQAVFPGVSARVAVPFGYMPNKMNNYHSAGIDEGYFMGLSNVVSPVQIEEKIAELRAHPEEDLVVSPEGFDQCLVHRGSQATMEQLFLLPYVPPPRREVSLFVPYCTYIQDHYVSLQKATSRTFGYGTMRLRTGQ